MRNTATLSIRLPDSIRVSLDKASESTHRSRSFLVKEALERHLGAIVQEQNGAPKNRLDRLLALKGIGARLYGPRSTEEIDAGVDEFRQDE